MTTELEYIKETLLRSLMEEAGNLEQADAKEMGEVVDMIKDIAEAEYYCTVTEAMHSNKYYDPSRDMDREKGKMYYSNPNPTSWQAPKDHWEGRSPVYRKMYVEAKEMKHGKEVQMKELDSYMQELTSDIVDMIHDASPEEKALLHKKV